MFVQLRSCTNLRQIRLIQVYAHKFMYAVKVRNPRITPKRRVSKSKIPIIAPPNLEDGSYFNSSTLSRSQILPLSEKTESENQSDSSKDWRPGSSRGASNGESLPTGIPYSLRLKMSRRRRNNQRRTRRSRNAKPKVVPLNGRKTNSPTKLQPIEEIPSMSLIPSDQISVPSLRVGPPSRARNNIQQFQPSTYKLEPPSAAVRNIRVGPRSRQNPHLPVGNPGFEPSPGRIETRDLDVRFARTSPVQIAVTPAYKREVDQYSSPGEDSARYRVPMESRTDRAFDDQSQYISRLDSPNRQRGSNFTAAI